MYDMILIRYGEMTLKKKNYRTFLKQINQNIKMKCQGLKKLTFFNTDYRFYIYLNGENCDQVIQILNTIVGLSSYSLCKKVKNSDKENLLDDICLTAKNILEAERPIGSFTFKVETNRGDKTFPMTSIEISQYIAKKVLPQIPNMHVDVHHPDLYLAIDLRTEGTYLYTKVIKGLGGYPSNTAGSGLAMISGGLDSPVAMYLAMRKGLNVAAVHFASPPYTSDLALQKVIDLLQQLTHYTSNGQIDLFVVPFTKIQKQINDYADTNYLITLMRRAMYKIGTRLAKDKNFLCLINGESLGQVASQTLESIFAVNEVTTFPIIRPLATYDKEEIIALAKKINTFEISIRPYEDCCTVFVPEHPVIKPKLSLVIKEEEKCNLDKLIDEAYQEIVIHHLNSQKKVNVFDLNTTDKFEI